MPPRGQCCAAIRKSRLAFVHRWNGRSARMSSGSDCGRVSSVVSPKFIPERSGVSAPYVPSTATSPVVGVRCSAGWHCGFAQCHQKRLGDLPQPRRKLASVFALILLNGKMVEVAERGDKTPEQNRNEKRENALPPISGDDSLNESPKINKRQHKPGEIEEKVNEHSCVMRSMQPDDRAHRQPRRVDAPVKKSAKPADVR